MGRMRARTEEEVKARKKDIVRSCEKLLETREFEEVSLADIAEVSSISRPSMYNYYQKKDDVFLDLMEEKYLEWGRSAEKIL